MGEVIGIRGGLDPPRFSGVEGRRFEVFHLGHRAWLYDRAFRWRWQAKLWAWRRERRDGFTRVVLEDPEAL